MKICLPLALLLTAAPLYAADSPAEKGTRLELSATGTVNRVPDMARIEAGVVTQAGTAAAAMQANAQRMTATIAALRKAGVAGTDIQTSALTLAPQYRYDNGQPPVLTGYQASNRVAVRLRGIERAGAVIDSLVAAGANQIDGPELTLDKPDAALDEARAQAIATARARADLYARAAGLHVARITQIVEQAAAPSPIRPMMMTARAKAADNSPIEAGEQALSVTVTVTFALD